MKIFWIKRGFTLIELLIVVAIMLILMALISAGSGLFINRTKNLDTRNTFQTIHQALLTYKSVSGVYPLVPQRTFLFRVCQALTEPIPVYDYKNTEVRAEPAILRPSEIQDLIDKKRMRVDGGGNYFFLDAWQRDILYYYGPISATGATEHGHPNDLATMTGFNVRYPLDMFDLISHGANGTQDVPGSAGYDDLTNFK